MAKDPGELDLRLWGKSRGLPAGVRYPVVCHLLDTAAVMRELWNEALPAGVRRWLAVQLDITEEHAGTLVSFWAGLHDIGKLTPPFQQQVGAAWTVLRQEYPAPVQADFKHDAASQVWLSEAFKAAGYAHGPLDEPVAFTASQILGGHHGCFKGRDGSVSVSKQEAWGMGTGLWETQRRATFELLEATLGTPQPPTRVPASAAALITGLVILADWLVSSTTYIKGRLADVPARGTPEALADFYQRSIEATKAVVLQAGLGRLRLRPGTFEEECDVKEANELQKSIATKLPPLLNGPGLLIIPSQTGSGKTEAAFHAARLMAESAGSEGIYFALPTMATADQMFTRLTEYLGRRADGDAPTTLLHGMAWLSPVYTQVTEDANATDIATDDPQQAVAATDWLRGPKRGLLAPAGVGTIDQALLAVLPARHNVLRLAGLAGKVVIFDEIHAFDSYTGGLLCTLLRWLGELGVPVILLSATLPRRLAQQLVDAYVNKKGSKTTRRRRQEPALEVTPPYPGWVYVDAATKAVTHEPVTVADVHTRELVVSRRDITFDADGRPNRDSALRAELTPLVEEGGCAAVICTTVTEAQQVFARLRDWFTQIGDDGKEAPEVMLLHSRFPAWQRERITSDLIAAFGKNGDRPRKAVVVATQVIEQSLDVCFDLVISDLAPIELLLQRAGRCHRHASNLRPSWARQPRVVVLSGAASADDIPALPGSWAFIYEAALLIKTFRLLQRRGAEPIQIPADVQALVDDQHEDTTLDDGIDEAVARLKANDGVKSMDAHNRAVPSPARVGDLAELTARNVDEDWVATRFNADSVRVLPCFVDDDGRRWLDRERLIPLRDVPGDGRGWFTRDELIEIMRHTVPVPRAAGFRDVTAENEPPEAWQESSHLRRLLLLHIGSLPMGPSQMGRSGAGNGCSTRHWGSPEWTPSGGHDRPQSRYWLLVLL